MSFVQIWVHAVWGTKYREKVMSKGIKERICDHILSNAREKGYWIDSIDGDYDHLHALISLGANMCISKQMQLIKGESSNWINKNSVVRGHFGWADDYYAVSVSPGDLDRVRASIRGQEEHHRKMSFDEECDLLMKKFGFTKHSHK